MHAQIFFTAINILSKKFGGHCSININFSFPSTFPLAEKQRIELTP